MQLYMVLGKLRGLCKLCLDAGSMPPSAVAMLRERCPSVDLVQPHWAGAGPHLSDMPAGAFC